MAQSNRQRNLFAAEDFKVVYDSFKQANFQAYDYDSIRAALVDYIQQQYPENFNDWIQSSEFVALIETLSFLAHSLAFRVDQAGRENFLSTAERRESVLRIADFLGYTPARHTPARGQLKVTGIKTTQTVYDINGNTLKNKVINFEDDFQNFLLVSNEVFSVTNKFGRPSESTRIGNVKTDVYQTNITANREVVFPFSGDVNGNTNNFEIHGLGIDATTKRLVESIPDPSSSFDLVYMNDGQGLGSNATGFFVGFKQGNLQFNDINTDSAIADLIVDVGAVDVNNSDVWIQNIDSAGEIQNNWTKINSGFGAGTVFNNIRHDNRKLFSVKTVENDNINVIFGDGVFSEIPRGTIRIWYRTGLNQSYTLEPADLSVVNFSFKYNAADGNTYKVTYTCQLQETVSNASQQETITSIKQNAGRVFATQDRMVTADDYSSYPLTVSENVKKIKAVNRTYAGHSRFIKAQDPTGQYQTVDMLARDGYVYREGVVYRNTIKLPSIMSSEQIFEKYLDGVIKNPEVINLFYAKYNETEIDFSVEAASFEWQKITTGYQGSTGYLTRNGVIQKAGATATSDLNILREGAIVEFIETPYNAGSIGEIGSSLTITGAGSGYTTVPTVTIKGTGIDATATATITGGQLTSVIVTNGGTSYQNPVIVEITGGGGAGAEVSVVASNAQRSWAKVVGISDEAQGINDSNGNPTGLTNKGQGAIILNKAIPNTARISRIFPAYKTVFSDTEREDIITEIINKNSFGLRFDVSTNKWIIISAGNMPASVNDNPDNFSFDFAGNQTNANLDSSWIVRMEYSASAWTIRTRRERIVFGSDTAIRFYNQNGNRKFNIETNKPERDSITISGINTQPSGSLYALGDDMLFYAYKYFTEADGYTDDHKLIITLADIDNDNYPDNPLAFKDLVGTDTISLNTVYEDGFNYTVRADTGSSATGREFLTFVWRRISTSNYRIDPSLSNIIDIFVLGQNYNTKYKEWLAGNRVLANQPAAPTSLELESQFQDMHSKKTVGDSIIYRPAKYKLIFGELADVELQGKFNIIKVSGTTLTDNEIKSRILTAITEFFDIDNWDFGETFYFTELSAYIHQKLAGIVSSVTLNSIQNNAVFGDLYQIEPESNELFIPDVTLSDIDIVNTLV